VTDRKQQVTDYQYDDLDRLSVVTFQDSSTTTYTYDAGDRLTQIADSINGTITRGYDNFDRLTSETTPQGSISYTYDADGRRATMTVAGQSQVTYGYDNAHRLTSITQGTSVVSISYDEADRRSTLTYPNGIVVTYGYDNANQLTDLVYTLNSNPLGDLTYTYDLAGQRISVGGSWARTGLPQTLTSAAYDAGNRLLTWGSQAFSYDPNGNLASDGPTSYVWDARNQLSTLSGATNASFQYDGTGRRRGKTINAATTNFLYDGPNFVQELLGTAPTANLLTGLGIDETFTRTDAAGARNLLIDALGSTLALTDASGSVQTQYAFEPFGGTVGSGAASGNSAQFTGRENDLTALFYYRARYYSPSFERFSAEDPVGPSGINANLYTYARVNPTGYVDPTGLWSVGIGLSGLAGGGLGITGSLTLTYVSNGDIGIQLTGGIEAVNGVTASVTGVAQLSNARSLGDLEGLFGQVGGSVGDGVVGGVDVFAGRGQDGAPVYGGSGGAGLGGKFPIPFPGETHGGVTDTKAWGCNVITWTCGGGRKH